MPTNPATLAKAPGVDWRWQLTLCAALLAPLPLAAQTPPTLPPFERLDENGDDSIDTEEARRHGLTENLIRQADADRDRRASREEYRQWRERRADSRQRDATSEQAPAAPPPQVVTGEERQRPPPQVVTGEERQRPPLATAPFDELDRDRDGVLGPDDARDLPTVRRNRLEDMDRDGDGRVQRSEFDQQQQRRAQERTLDTPQQAAPGL